MSQHALRPLSDLPIILEAKGARRPSRNTIQRWVTFGVRGRVLETSLVGGLRYFTLEALERFLTPPRTGVGLGDQKVPTSRPAAPQGPEDAAYWVRQIDAISRGNHARSSQAK